MSTVLTKPVPAANRQMNLTNSRSGYTTMLEEDALGKKLANPQHTGKFSLDAAEKIKKIAVGLTHDEFIIAMKLAIDYVDSHLIFEPRPTLSLDDSKIP